MQMGSSALKKGPKVLGRNSRWAELRPCSQEGPDGGSI